MRPILDIALNQIRLTFNERGAIISSFVVPIIMMFFLGSAINGSPPSGDLVDVMRGNSPADDMANNFVSLLRAQGKDETSGADRYIVCDLSKPADQPAACKLSDLKAGVDMAAFAKQRVTDSVTVASVTLPDSFSADLKAGKNVAIQIGTRGSPTTDQAVQAQVGAVTARLSGSILAANTVTQRSNGDATFYDKVYNAAQSVWAKDPIQIQQVSSTVTGTQVGSGFGQSAPGIGAMFVLISALNLGQVFIQERKNGTLFRLMVLPLSRSQILAGKLLGQFLVCLLTFTLMIVFGTIFGVHWGDLMGVVVVVLAYTLAVTALGLAFSTIARTSGQAQGFSLLAAMILAPLGGAWWTLSIVPVWMQQIGRISPIYWSQDAFTRMIFYGATLTDILPNIAVLLVFAAVLFTFGLSRFQYE